MGLTHLDTRCLAGHQKSTKQRKAEKLIEAGAALRIVGESDFRRLVESAYVCSRYFVPCHSRFG